MGLSGSNCGLFRVPGFIVSPVGKRERGGEKKRRREGGKKGIENEKKEGKRSKKNIQGMVGRNFNKN